MSMKLKLKPFLDFDKAMYHLIDEIEKEAKVETFYAGSLDFRPTAKEQLRRIAKMIEDFKADL